MAKTFERGLLRRSIALMLGAVLVLGLMPGLGASVALATEDTYTLEEAVAHNGPAQINTDPAYKLGTVRQITVTVDEDVMQQSATQYAVIRSQSGSVQDARVDWTPHNATATVTYSVSSEGTGGFNVVFSEDEAGNLTKQVTTVNVKCTKNAPGIPVTSVTLDKASATLSVGDELELKATVLPENATNPELVWSSSDPNIVDVDEAGNVTAMDGGKATITAKSTDGSNKSASCEITVVKPVPVESVTLDKTSATLAVGDTLHLNGTVLPKGATGADLVWSSSDPNIATVDGAGNVKAVAGGTATITATAGGKSAACTVTVANAPEEKGTYAVTAGNKSTWTKGSSKELHFTFNRIENPEFTFKKFVSMKVDGKDIDNDNYTATEGSVNIALKASYLETLAVGDHTLTAVFEDGSADATFTVVAATAATPAKASSKTSPKTGDTAPVAVLAVCAALSFAVLLVARTRARKPVRGKHVR